MEKTPIELYQILLERFNESELRDLCFRLPVDYDGLPGEGKFDKARELIAYLDRRGMLGRLVETGKQLRPETPWGDPPREPSGAVKVEPQQPQISFGKWLRSKWTIILLSIVVAIRVVVLLFLILRPHTFSNTHSSRLYFDQTGDRINLEVCADNLPGQIVFARLSRPGGSFDVLFQRASGRCTTFVDMDGEGPALSNTTYTTRAALNWLPDDAWPVPCYEATKGWGLCDSAQYSPPDDAVFPIEKGPVSAGLYEGIKDADTGKGTGYLEVTSGIVDEQPATSYKLYYSIPSEGAAYAGISLWFSEPQDLSEYNFIELTISFGDDQARCRLYVKDSFGGDGFVTLGDGDIVSAKRAEQTIKIPLKSFSSLSRKFVKKLDFDVNGEFVRGDSSFAVSGIRFLK